MTAMRSALEMLFTSVDLGFPPFPLLLDDPDDQDLWNVYADLLQEAGHDVGQLTSVSITGKSRSGLAGMLVASWLDGNHGAGPVPVPPFGDRILRRRGTRTIVLSDGVPVSVFRDELPHGLRFPQWPILPSFRCSRSGLFGEGIMGSMPSFVTGEERRILTVLIGYGAEVRISSKKSYTSGEAWRRFWRTLGAVS